MILVMNKPARTYLILSLTLIASVLTLPAKRLQGKLVRVGDGYSATSVNAAVFRGSSLATHGDTQYIGYYIRTVESSGRWRESSRD